MPDNIQGTNEGNYLIMRLLIDLAALEVRHPTTTNPSYFAKLSYVTGYREVKSKPREGAMMGNEDIVRTDEVLVREMEPI